MIMKCFRICGLRSNERRQNARVGNFRSLCAEMCRIQDSKSGFTGKTIDLVQFGLDYFTCSATYAGTHSLLYNFGVSYKAMRHATLEPLDDSQQKVKFITAN
jgi:hypothetical protein